MTCPQAPKHNALLPLPCHTHILTHVLPQTHAPPPTHTHQVINAAFDLLIGGGGSPGKPLSALVLLLRATWEYLHTHGLGRLLAKPLKLLHAVRNVLLVSTLLPHQTLTLTPTPVQHISWARFLRGLGRGCCAYGGVW